MADIFRVTLADGKTIRGESVSDLINRVAFVCDCEDTLIPAAEKDAKRLVKWEDTSVPEDSIAVIDGNVTYVIVREL